MKISVVKWALKSKDFRLHLSFVPDYRDPAQVIWALGKPRILTGHSLDVFTLRTNFYSKCISYSSKFYSSACLYLYLTLKLFLDCYPYLLIKKILFEVLIGYRSAPAITDLKFQEESECWDKWIHDYVKARFYRDSPVFNMICDACWIVSAALWSCWSLC